MILVKLFIYPLNVLFHSVTASGLMGKSLGEPEQEEGQPLT